MLVAALHLVIGLIGAVLLYVALFLRETEEGKLQNRLEELWIEIDDLSKAALSRQTAFLQRVSALANSGLNKLFGVRPFSAGAVSASLCFSFGSVSFFLAYLFGHVTASPHAGQFSESPNGELILAYLVLPLVILGFISFLIGLLSTPYRYFAFLWIPVSLYFAAAYDLDNRGFDWNPLQWHWFSDENLFMVLIMLVGGFASDVFFIAVTRWCLAKGSLLTKGWEIAFLLTLNGTIGLVLISPVLWGSEGFINTKYRSHSTVKLLLEVLGASNFVAGTISVFFILLALTALLHLAVWPILERPLYSLQRYGLVRQPKMLAAASVTCLVFAWPHSPIIQAITKLVHG